MRFGLGPYVAFAIAIAVTACGSSGTSAPSSTGTPSTPSSNTGSTSTPQGCQPWPAVLADEMRRLTLPSGLCLMPGDGQAIPAEYKPSLRQIINRPTNTVAGQDGALAHELIHAYQHSLILQAGLPDAQVGGDDGAWLNLNWIKTRAGQDYLQAGGYTFLGIGGSCVRGVESACWNVDRSKCEMGFCVPEYQNPIEDNAQFGAVWYNPTGLAMWSRSQVMSASPRRSAWAATYLP